MFSTSSPSALCVQACTHNAREHQKQTKHNPTMNCAFQTHRFQVPKDALVSVFGPDRGVWAQCTETCACPSCWHHLSRLTFSPFYPDRLLLPKIYLLQQFLNLGRRLGHWGGIVLFVAPLDLESVAGVVEVAAGRWQGFVGWDGIDTLVAKSRGKRVGP